MSIIHYKPIDEILISALEGNPNHIVYAAYKTIVDLINDDDCPANLELEENIIAKNGTEAVSSLVRILGTDSACKLKILIKRAISNPKFNYTAKDVLKPRSLVDLKYQVVPLSPENIETPNVPILVPDGGLIPSNNSTSILVPNSSSSNKSTPYKINPKTAPTLSLADPLKAWFTAQLQGLARESQINELNIKITNFENTVNTVQTLATNFNTLKSVVPTRNEMKDEIAKVEVKVNTLLVNESVKIVQSVESNQLEISSNRDDITNIMDKIKEIQDFGVSTSVGISTTPDVVVIALANQFVCGNKMYWRAINFGKRSGVFMMIVKNADLYKELPAETGAPVDAKKCYELNFARLQKVLGVKITAVNDFNMRLSLAGNLVAKCRLLTNNPAETFTKMTALINRKHDKTISKFVHIQLVTPDEFDISDVLDIWVDTLKCAVKYDVTKSGGVTVMVNDGVTFDASGTLPAVTADKKDKTYLETCSRINILNPHETAKLENPTVSNLRKLASGKWFVANGQMFEYPSNFKRVPRNPGFVNSTYDRLFSGEFGDSEDDDDKWSVHSKKDAAEVEETTDESSDEN